MIDKSRRKRCFSCKRKFYPYKHILDQKYCSRLTCQEDRKKRWRCSRSKYNMRNEVRNKSKFENPVLEITLKKDVLVDLSETKTTNCYCRLILMP